MTGKSLHIERYGLGSKQTIGRLFVLDECNSALYNCHTLELAWKNNQTSISCIPEGDYKVTKRKSAKFGNHFHVLDVAGRSYILIHPGNYYTQTRGCILVGRGLTDINHDGLVDVISSKATLADLLAMMPQDFNLKITTV